MNELDITKNRDVTQSKPKLPRLIALDGLRIFMIAVVVFSHFEFLQNSEFGDFYTTYLHRGGFAVDFFFILSGFGIYYVSREKYFNCSFKGNILYAINKIKKIYPIYLISLILGLCYSIPFWIKYNTNFLKTIVKIVVYLGLDLTFLQSITGMTVFSHAINGVCWFLSSLFISYMFCPTFINIVHKADNKKKTVIGLVITLVIIVCLSFVASSIDGKFLGGRLNDLYYGHPFIRCFYLLFGMFVSSLFSQIKIKLKNTSGVEIIIVIAYIIYFVFRSNISDVVNVELVRVFDILVTSVLIFTFAIANGFIASFLSKKTVVSLGNDAMYIFLFHYPIRMTVGVIDEKINLVNYCGSLAYIIQIAIIIIGTIVMVIVGKILKDPVARLVNPLFELANKVLS
jgi:peptidoglycan/LPS O-acetylase OafA/YrhL